MGAGVGKNKISARPPPVQYDSFNDYLRKRPSERDQNNKTGAPSVSKTRGAGGGSLGASAASSSEEERLSSASERHDQYKRKYQMAAMPSQEGWHEKKHRSKERGSKRSSSTAAPRELPDGHNAKPKNPLAGREDVFFEWQHGNDWRPYEGKYQEILRHAFAKDYPTIKFFINNTDYEVNFRQMTQKNLRTGNVKKIRYAAPVEEGLNLHNAKTSTAGGENAGGGRMPEAKFQWMEGADKWKDFDWAADKLLWNEYKRGMATTRITVVGHNYDIDFLENTQTNVRTKKTRKIRLKNIIDQGMRPEHDFRGKNFSDEKEEKPPAGTDPPPAFDPTAANFSFQFLEESNQKWLNYPKSEQKMLAEAWARKQDDVFLGGAKVDFRTMKENGTIPVRRIEIAGGTKNGAHKQPGQPYGTANNANVGAGTAGTGAVPTQRMPQDNPHNKRDAFEWFDEKADCWHVFTPAHVDKQLKHAWLNKDPTVKIELKFEHEEEIAEVEVNFEMLKMKWTSYDSYTGEQKIATTNIRSPIKFGAFRRNRKSHQADNADFFADLNREKQKEKDAQFRKTPKEWDGIWGRRFSDNRGDRDDLFRKDRWRNAFFGNRNSEHTDYENRAPPPGAERPDAGPREHPGPGPPPPNMGGAAGPRAGARNSKAGGGGGGGDPFERANFGQSQENNANAKNNKPARPTPLPTGPKLDASVNVVTRELQEKMEAALNEPLADRKAKIKRWQLLYHPDKNPEKGEKYTQVFQFLMQHKEWFLLGASPNTSPNPKGGGGGGRRPSG